MDDPIKTAVRLMLEETHAHAAYASRCREFFQWDCNNQMALMITLGWLRSSEPLRPEAIALAISTTGLDFVTPILKHQSEQRQMDGLDYEETAVLESLSH